MVLFEHVRAGGCCLPARASEGLQALSSERKYWFPAKRYGWGWGIPSSWQGWLVMAAFIALLVLGTLLVPPGTNLGAFLFCVGILSALLIAVCWLKGEPPRWRWGDDK